MKFVARTTKHILVYSVLLLVVAFVRQSVGHNNHFKPVIPSAQVYYISTGQGPGLIRTYTRVFFRTGAHNTMHNHQGYYYMHQVITEGIATITDIGYWFGNSQVIRGQGHTDEDATQEETLSGCHRGYAHAEGNMGGYENGIVNSYWEICPGGAATQLNAADIAGILNLSWNNDDVLSELQSEFEDARAQDSTVIGVSNINGQLSVIRDGQPSVDLGMSEVTLAIPAAPHKLRPKTVTTAWGALKKQQ